MKWLNVSYSHWLGHIFHKIYEEVKFIVVIQEHNIGPLVLHDDK